jgi:exonuclease SbcC
VISTELSEFTKLDACYNLLKMAFAKTGIAHSIARKSIPIIEAIAGQILNAMTGNSLDVGFVLDKQLRNKKEVIALDVIITDNTPNGTGALAYLSRSGGERLKASLAVILALAELKASQNGTQLGFLFIDEPPFLDSDGVNAYCDALETIRHRYPDLKIMAITHDEEMKTRFPQNIFVYRDDTGSRFAAAL